MHEAALVAALGCGHIAGAGVDVWVEEPLTPPLLQFDNVRRLRYDGGLRLPTSYLSSSAKRGELPIEQPTKFKLFVNLKTGKALGIKMPQSILVRADR